MSKRKKAKRFLGYEVTRNDVSAIASLIGLTTLTIGLSKRKIKSEEEFWTIVNDMFGLRRNEGEQFMPAVRRVRNEIKRMSDVDRHQKRNEFREKTGRGTVEFKPSNIFARSAARGPSVKAKDEFYASWEWRTLRMEVLKEHGRACQCCGATPCMKDVSGKPVRIVVDHIKPLSKHWSLRLVRTNLQILCDECNQGKGAWDETDYREPIEDSTDGEDHDHLTEEYRAIMGPPANARAA